MTGRTQLRVWLEATKTSQRALAVRLRVSDAAVSDWLSGHRTPKRDTMIDIEQATGGMVRCIDWRSAPAVATPPVEIP